MTDIVRVFWIYACSEGKGRVKFNSICGIFVSNSYTTENKRCTIKWHIQNILYLRQRRSFSLLIGHVTNKVKSVNLLSSEFPAIFLSFLLTLSIFLPFSPQFFRILPPSSTSFKIIFQAQHIFRGGGQKTHCPPPPRIHACFRQTLALA